MSPKGRNCAPYTIRPTEGRGSTGAEHGLYPLFGPAVRRSQDFGFRLEISRSKDIRIAGFGHKAIPLASHPVCRIPRPPRTYLAGQEVRQPPILEDTMSIKRAETIMSQFLSCVRQFDAEVRMAMSVLGLLPKR